MRLSFLNNGSGAEVLEENNYYPFGLKHEGYNVLTGNPANQYKYNGKELQEFGMYDYGARFYMPDIGRWGVMDALSEKYRRHSPYNYAVNNPIMFTDPDGNSVETFSGQKAMDVFIGIRDNMPNNELSGSNYFSGFDFTQYGADDDGGRRRSRQRENNRSRTGSLMFDARGQELLSHWLNGSGKDLVFNDGNWGEYMIANEKLNAFLYKRAFTESRGMLDNNIRTKTFDSGNFNFEIENGYYTGYEMLHGTNYFSYSFTSNYDSYNKKYAVEFTVKWFDTINPNKGVSGDVIMSKTLNTFYTPKDYNISIMWHKTFIIEEEDLRQNYLRVPKIK